MEQRRLRFLRWPQQVMLMEEGEYREYMASAEGGAGGAAPPFPILLPLPALAASLADDDGMLHSLYDLLLQVPAGPGTQLIRLHVCSRALELCVVAKK